MSAIWLQKTSIDRLGGAGVAIDTEVSISELPRVAAAVLHDTRPIRLRIRAQESDRGIVLIDGDLQAMLVLTCQRCLDEMSVGIDSSLRLALLSQPIEEDLIPAGYEPLVIPAGKVRLADLVEDEILLELPIAPRHADQDCGPLKENVKALKGSASKTETTTPFAGLADMMRDAN
ncbi:MAG: YceD family protein [Gammaproteobacteria bacterium]|nr:YceD family protein [Gammaproteobacteria bacterium]MDH3767054.1 YceD family protein [Gammaproteobacteria bacterium]